MCTVYVYFRKCLQRYKFALLIIDTDEMWDKYLTAMIKMISDDGILEFYKTILFKESIHGAHKKNKLKLNHYIELVRDLNFVSLACTFNLYYFSFQLCCLDK